MATAPQGEDDHGQREADAQADAMKERLLKDVESWSKARSERSGQADGSGMRLGARSPSAPVARTRKSSVDAPTVKAGNPAKKPFSMSYGGVTTTEYVRQNLVRRER
jgi:hypothetical protein